MSMTEEEIQAFLTQVKHDTTDGMNVLEEWFSEDNLEQRHMDVLARLMQPIAFYTTFREEIVQTNSSDVYTKYLGGLVYLSLISAFQLGRSSKDES